MKKILLLGIFFLSLSCSTEDTETNINGTLNIPEVFRGEFEGVQTHHRAKVYSSYLQVETNRGLKTITEGTNESFNGNNLYQLDLPNNERLVLTQANGFVGITIFDSEGDWIISDYFD